MAEIILTHVPLGSSIEDAKRFMEREGFTWTNEINEEFSGRDGKMDYIYCDRSVGFIVKRRWQIALVYKEGKVTEVLANTGLVGP